MISPGDHENMAISQVQQGEYQAAIVSALLALAAAVERLAEAHETIAGRLSTWYSVRLRFGVVLMTYINASGCNCLARIFDWATWVQRT